jgi:hypothetical protein
MAVIGGIAVWLTPTQMQGQFIDRLTAFGCWEGTRRGLVREVDPSILIQLLVVSAPPARWAIWPSHRP